MFLVAAYDFAGTIIIDIVRTENGFGIVRSEWIEFLQVAEEFRSDVSEINLIIRVDYIITEGEKINLLEVNTTPGMTATSFIPQQVRAAGMEMKDVMTDIIENKFKD